MRSTGKMGQGAGGLGRGNRPQRSATILATVGGLGNVPLGPGTWGSLVGLFVGLAIVRSLSQPSAAALLSASFVLFASICTVAERELGQHDPGSVILDEVWGMAAVVVAQPWLAASWMLLVAFVLFRLFDIFKVPPLKLLARWPAGWGIMADDLGAAAYTILILWLARQAAGFMPQAAG